MVRRFVCVSFIAMMALPAVLESVDVESLLLKRRVMKSPSPMQTHNESHNTVQQTALANSFVTPFLKEIKKCLQSITNECDAFPKRNKTEQNRTDASAESQIGELYVLREHVDILEARITLRALLTALEQHRPQARQNLVGAIIKLFRFDREYYNKYLEKYFNEYYNNYAVENVDDEANEFFRRDAALIVKYLEKKAK